MVTVTANIGTGVMRSALRLQENFVEYKEEKHIEKLSTGCYSCEHACGSEACASCQNKIYETHLKKVYRNEKNRYGSRKALKRNAIMLFMYFHYLNPDKAGHVYIDIEDAAKVIGCDVKTIRNNLYLLNKEGYIILGKTDCPGYYQLFITDYKNYFKKASENGRGYTTLSKEFFYELLKLKDINSLRLVLRNFLFSIESGAKNIGRKERTYKEVKRELPKYVTQKSIKETLKSQEFGKLFDVTEKKRTVIMNVKQNFNPLEITNRLRSECYNKVMNFIQNINNNRKMGKLFSISTDEMDDITSIALKYPLNAILKGLNEFYNDYIVQGEPVYNTGALLRTIVKSTAEVGACI